MNRGGRPKDVIWEYFYEIRDNRKVEAKCKKCGHQLASRVERMKTHFSKCHKSQNNQEEQAHINDDAQEKCEDLCRSPKRPRLQAVMNSYVSKTDAKTKESLDLQVARFFYACNIPFLAVEQPEFLTLCSMLRPGYKPPNRKQLAEGLLSEVCESLEQNMKTELDGKECTLIEDGWSNIHNEPVIGTCLHSEGKSYFLRATESGSNSKTAEYCKENAKISMNFAKTKFNCSVTSFVTDNAKSMEKMRKMLNEEDSTLLVYGCSSHWLNLLGQDITPSQVVKHVVEIQKYFRNHHLPAAWLKEHVDAIKPQLPNDTRWNSTYHCIETFVRNRSSYMKICEEHDGEIDSNIESLVNNFNLYKNAKDLMMQLKPISITLDILQGDTATLSDACHYWLKLATNDDLKPHLLKIKNRTDQALKPFHYLAYLTSPSYKGQLLSEDQKEQARNWLFEQQPENLEYLITFEAETKPYPESFFKVRSLSPSSWWKGLQKNGIPLSFINLMIKLHTCPCSSASVERVFSNFGYVHNKIRNRLGIERTSKLVFCYRMLRGPKEIEY